MPHRQLEVTPGLKRIKEILGCKWSIPILMSLQEGARRPKCIVKETDGLSDRVLHRCLNRMLEDQLISRNVFSVIPPHTEYSLTERGKGFLRIVATLQKFSADWTGGTAK